jgi:F0F1-type ATP synthase assembly protein I
MSDPGPRGWLPPGALKLAGAGVELAAGLGACCLVGYWIDRRLETGPWGLLICAVIGVIGGLYNLIRRAVHETLQGSMKGKGGRKPPPGEAT